VMATGYHGGRSMARARFILWDILRATLAYSIPQSPNNGGTE